MGLAGAVIDEMLVPQGFQGISKELDASQRDGASTPIAIVFIELCVVYVRIMYQPVYQ